jgi:phage I-like protein
VVERFEDHGCDLPIDYEHQTLGGSYASPTGQAPAAGWIKRLEAKPGEGIVAHVHWTDPATEQLAERQYRYLSPVAVVRKSDRKLVALHSVALTNKPAIVGMQPIVNHDGAGNCTVQDSECGIQDRGVPPTTNSTICDVQAKVGSADEAGGALRRQLALEAECSDSEVLVAATRRLAVLEDENRQRRAADRVAAAMAAGKLTPAQRNWASRLCLSDESLFDEYVGTAPVVVQTGRLEAPAASNGPGGEAAIATRARSEYRSHPELAALTSEEAYVAEALREKSSEFRAVS